MEPRVVLISRYRGQADPSAGNADALIRDLFSTIGVWVFGRAKNAVWQLREQFQVAHAVLVLVEPPPPPNYFEVNEAFDLEIAELLKYHQQNPRLQVMTIAERHSELLSDLTRLPTLVFDKELTPPEVRQIVEFVFNAARPVIEGTTPAVDNMAPDVDMLLAKASLELKRLEIIRDESEISVAWPMVSAVVTLAGLALSIPGLLSRLGLSDYWLFFGPVIFIVGALTTIYFIRRHKRGRIQKKLANLLKEELASVLYEFGEQRKPTIATSETIPT
ncbi:MAG TPA: hypothetical protein VGW58_00835 [Pyrinomonadaceae bacterium]|nr:hypothetical protein [Pyrinomonadaceae bacterium]